MYSHSLKIWDAKEDLHHSAEVASVSKVFDARVPRTKHCLQFHARLLDHLPFTDPRPAVVVCVVAILCLRQWRESLFYFIHLPVETLNCGVCLQTAKTTYSVLHL